MGAQIFPMGRRKNIFPAQEVTAATRIKSEPHALEHRSWSEKYNLLIVYHCTNEGFIPHSRQLV